MSVTEHPCDILKSPKKTCQLEHNEFIFIRPCAMWFTVYRTKITKLNTRSKNGSYVVCRMSGYNTIYLRSHVQLRSSQKEGTCSVLFKINHFLWSWNHCILLQAISLRAALQWFTNDVFKGMIRYHNFRSRFMFRV